MIIPVQITFRGMEPSEAIAAKIRSALRSSIDSTSGSPPSASRHDEQAHEDAYVAIRDAFDAMRRRLEDFARVQDNRSKVHEPPLHGTVTQIDSVVGFGRIETSDGRDVYFHQNSVEGDGFHRLGPGSPVRFDLYEGEGRDGPQASTVRPIGKHHFPDLASP